MQWKDAICLGAVIAVSSMTGACETGAAEDQRNLSGPYSFENLSVFLIHSEDSATVEDLLSLDEAVEKGYLTVFETGDVGELEMENTSDWPVYIQSGSVVKGGRQDRMLPHDIVVAAHSGKKPLASFCVEQGRWSARGEESDVIFKVAPALVADRDILMAAKVEESQSKVWEGVASKVDDFDVHVRGGRAANPISPSSLPMTLENEEIQNKTSAYVEAITSQTSSCTDATGMVVVINGKISSVDLYHGRTLFEKLFPKLIDAAAVEALAKSTEDGTKEQLTVEEIAIWLSAAEQGDSQSKNVGGTMFLRTIESENAISFESLSDTVENRWIHKNILSK
jgi:hypothetical protein